MAERRVLNRTVAGKRWRGPGGKRPGAGRPKGGTTERIKVARAIAARSGLLPDELLLDWARTGKMRYGTKTVELEPSERIACAKACAAWYKPPMQARPAPGEQPPVLRLEMDEKMLAALAAKQPNKLELLRDVLRAIQAGGKELEQAQQGQGAGDADAGRYGRLLTETSEVDGRA